MSSVSRHPLVVFYFFIISPFASIPFIFQALKGGKYKLPVIVISLLAGCISYLYVPNWSNDKAEYVKRYIQYEDFTGFTQFFNYVTDLGRADFLFELLNFTFSQAQISINVFFLFVTFLTVALIFLFNYREALSDQIRVGSGLNKSPLILGTVLCVLISFSLPHLFSQIRFYFAASLFLVGWSFTNIRNYGTALVYLLLAVLTHFSISLFLVLLIPFRLVLDKPSLVKRVFVVSLIFFFVPLSLVEEMLRLLPLPTTYSLKAELYLNSETEFTPAYVLINFYLKNLWLWLLYFFVLMSKPKQQRGWILFMLFSSAINIFASLPWVFGRYSILLKILGTTLFVKDVFFNKQKKHFKIVFVMALVLSFALDLYVMRYNFMASFKLEYILTIINIAQRNVGFSDFL